MARFFSVILFCLLALNLNQFVFGEEAIDVLIRASDDRLYEPISLKSSTNKTIDNCQVVHDGVEGIKNLTLSEDAFDNELNLYRTNETSCSFDISSIITKKHFGKYIVIGRLSNGTIVSENVVNLLRQTVYFELMDDKVNGTYGEYVSISLSENKILEKCNRQENKGLCPNNFFVNDTQVVCKVMKFVGGKREYYDVNGNSSGIKKFEKTGICEFKTLLSNKYDTKFGFDHIFYIEAWYGYMVIIKDIFIYGHY